MLQIVVYIKPEGAAKGSKCREHMDPGFKNIEGHKKGPGSW